MSSSVLPVDKGKGKEETKAPRDSDELVKPVNLVNRCSPKFIILVNLLEGLERFKKNKAGKPPSYRYQMLSKWVRGWRESVGLDLFPSIRLLLPARDTGRKTFGLKEIKLSNAYIAALDIDKKTDDAKNLLDWKAPSMNNPFAGDLSNVAYGVLERRNAVSDATLTIDEVNIRLDELSRASLDAKRSVNTKNVQKPGQIIEEYIRRINADMTALEQKWLIRIILKDLKLGIGESMVLDQIHPKANEYFLVCSDIKQVCWKLWDVEQELPPEEMRVQLFSAFKPMLSHRNMKSLKSIREEMVKPAHRSPEVQKTDKDSDFFFDSKSFLIEEKIDGERIQLHARFSESGLSRFKYFSRKAHDYTRNYGENEKTGALTPAIRKQFNPEITEIILDGEMLLYCPASASYVPFGTLKSGFKTEAIKENEIEQRPVFKAFDVIYIKTKSGGAKCMVDVALKYRLELLRECFTPLIGRLEFCISLKGKTVLDISNALDKVVSQRAEGLVIKNPDSKYTLNGRLSSWVKLKPEYMDAKGDTFDLVAIGGYYGTGGRSNTLSGFMFGLRDWDENGNPIYRTFTKVGGGYNIDTYEKIFSETRGQWFEADEPPSWFVTKSQIPNLYIDPTKSFVVEVKAAEVVEGLDYGAGFTLRFPRAIRLRDRSEKTHEDAMTMKELKAFKQKSPKRDSTQMLEMQTSKKFKTINGNEKMIASGLSDIVAQDLLFEGITFYVGVDRYEKYLIDSAILEHGGRVFQMIPPPDTPDSRLVISSSNKFKPLLDWENGKDINIVNTHWIYDSIDAGEQMPYSSYYTLSPLAHTEQSSDWNIFPTEEAKNAKIKRARNAEVDNQMRQTNAMHRPIIVNENTPNRYSANDEEVEGADESADDTDKEVEVEVEEITEQVKNGINLNSGEGDGMESDSEITIIEPPSASTSQILSTEEIQTQLKEVKMELDDLSVSQLDRKPDIKMKMEVEPETDEEFWTFSPRVFYLDSEENAQLNGLTLAHQNPTLTAGAAKEFKKCAMAIEKFGGTLTTNIKDPTLTDIIVWNKVPLRYLALMEKATRKPFAKRMLYTSWVIYSEKYDMLESEEKHQPNRSALVL